MVLRDRNHPSVIIWSIGNEIPNAPNRPAELTMRPACSDAVLAHRSTRPVTEAICGFWDHPGGLGQSGTIRRFAALDVGGYNYHGGSTSPTTPAIPERVMVGTEIATPRRPSRTGSRWRSILTSSATSSGRASITWASRASAGPGSRARSPADSRPWPWHIAGCGDLDILGRRKCCSYYREALWRPGVLYVAVHPPLSPDQEEQVSAWGWNDVRSHWTWPGQEGKTLKVDVYSSCDKVTLTLNGRTLGEKPTTRAERYLASFEVPYEAGELKAVGTVNGKTVEYVLKTAGAARCAQSRRRPQPDRRKPRGSLLRGHPGGGRQRHSRSAVRDTGPADGQRHR